MLCRRVPPETSPKPTSKLSPVIPRRSKIHSQQRATVHILGWEWTLARHLEAAPGSYSEFLTTVGGTRMSANSLLNKRHTVLFTHSADDKMKEKRNTERREERRDGGRDGRRKGGRERVSEGGTKKAGMKKGRSKGARKRMAGRASRERKERREKRKDHHKSMLFCPQWISIKSITFIYLTIK